MPLDRLLWTASGAAGGKLLPRLIQLQRRVERPRGLGASLSVFVPAFSSLFVAFVAIQLPVPGGRERTAAKATPPRVSSVCGSARS